MRVPCLFAGFLRNSLRSHLETCARLRRYCRCSTPSGCGDVLRAASDRFPGVPLAAYNVSGEYSMVKAAAEKGWLDEKNAALESLIAIRRAGAGIILTYWAKDVAQWLT